MRQAPDMLHKKYKYLNIDDVHHVWINELVALLLWHVAEERETPKFHALVSDGQVVNLYCGDYLLDILDIDYGSKDLVCEGVDEKCRAENGLAVVIPICQGMRKCMVGNSPYLDHIQLSIISKGWISNSNQIVL